MLEAVGHVGMGSSGAIRAVAASVAASAAQSEADSGVKVVPLSPRMKADPAAGVIIMEYLSETGEKSAQLPSEAVVAYLRSGLSADGTPIKNNAGLVETQA
jgi:hypothetical protein